MTDDLHLDLLGLPIAAGLARTLIAQRITKWGHDHILDDVLLVASELIVNAAEATPNVQIKLRLGHNTQGVFVGVWGLPIVAALSASCGLQPDEGGGKWLWATLVA